MNDYCHVTLTGIVNTIPDLTGSFVVIQKKFFKEVGKWVQKNITHRIKLTDYLTKKIKPEIEIGDHVTVFGELIIEVDSHLIKADRVIIQEDKKKYDDDFFDIAAAIKTEDYGGSWKI